MADNPSSELEHNFANQITLNFMITFSIVELISHADNANNTK